MTSPIEPICALNGPPCFAHDGAYLGRGPQFMERNCLIGRWRMTEDRRPLKVSRADISEQMVEAFGRCEAVGRGRHGESGFGWKAADARSSLHLELELVQWRIAKLEKFPAESEFEWRVFNVEMKALEKRERELFAAIDDGLS